MPVRGCHRYLHSGGRVVPPSSPRHPLGAGRGPLSPKLAVAQMAPVAGWVLDTGWVQPAAPGSLFQRGNGTGRALGAARSAPPQLTRFPPPSERFCFPSREPAGRGADGRRGAEAEAGGEGPAWALCECTGSMAVGGGTGPWRWPWSSCAGCGGLVSCEKKWKKIKSPGEAPQAEG